MHEDRPSTRRIILASDLSDDRKKRRERKRYEWERKKAINGGRRPEGRVLSAEDLKKRKERREYEKRRRREIDGWNRPAAQILKINSTPQVVSKTGLKAPGARIYTCPRCDGKKQMRVKDFRTPGAPPVVEIQNCKLCKGKGYLWI